MAKKKIALVNVFFAPQEIGGATRVLMDNVRVLQEKYGDRYEVVVFTSDHNFQSPHSVEPYIYKGIRIYRVGILHRVHMDWNAQDDDMRRVMAKFLDFEKPDLVHFHCIQRLTASIVPAVQERGIPYVVTVHDAWWISDFQFLVDDKGRVYPDGHPDPFVETPRPEGISRDESINRRAYLKDLLSHARCVLAVSETFADLYRMNGVDNVQPNRNGIRSREWLPRKPSVTGRTRLAHIGGMSNHKGYHLFKGALSRGQYQNLEAIVVDHAKPHGYERREMWGTVPVTFIGKVPQRLVDQLYSTIDVLVAPSIWPESYGLVTREATAAGCWVIASNMGGIGEDVEPGCTGDVISPTEEKLLEIFRRIDSMLQPPIPDDEARKRVRLVDEQVEQLVEIYEDMLTPSRRDKHFH